MNKVYDAHMRYMESKGLDRATALGLLLFAEANNLIESDKNDVQELWEEVILYAEKI